MVMAMLLKRMQNAKKLNETMDNACPINPKKTLGLLVIYSMPTGRPVEGPNHPRFPTHRNAKCEFGIFARRAMVDQAR